MALGHFVLAIQNDIAFFLALGFIVVGNGFFKPNISTFVGSLYKDKDPRKDSGFTIFYMGINTGAFQQTRKELGGEACCVPGHEYDGRRRDDVRHRFDHPLEHE